MFVSLAGYALDIRHPRVHVPAFTDSYLPGVTVSLKAGLSTYKGTAADALQRPLRCGFWARLIASVRLTEVCFMSAQIFISYRREDTASEAGRICSAIHQEFGEDSVFLDTSSIQAGAKWPEEIQSALKAAETIIVVIGPEWLRVGSN